MGYPFFCSVHQSSRSLFTKRLQATPQDETPRAHARTNACAVRNFPLVFTNICHCLCLFQSLPP
eukprot:4579075-Amphidinium_carterae.1